MSQLKVDAIRHTGASSDAITLANDGTATANITDYGRKNHLINGNFLISQRNGTTAYTGNSYGGPDRWAVNQSGATTSFQQVAFGMGDQLEGSKYYAKFTSNGNDYSWIHTHVEDVTKWGGVQVTLSFWAKYVTAKPDGGFNCRLVQHFGTGGSPSDAVTTYWGGANTSESFTPTTSWARYQWTLTLPSISGKTMGTTANTSSLQFVIGQGNNAGGTDWELNITNVKLEYGPKASKFEAPDAGDELLKCQRYYEEISQHEAGGMPVAIGQDYNTRKGLGYINFKVTKRVAPTAPDVSIGIDGGDANHTCYFNTTTSGTTIKSSSSTSIGNADVTTGAWTAKFSAEL